MKRLMAMMFFLALGAAFQIFLSGCGANSSGSTTAANGVCSTGYVYSSTYGCLAQSTCSAGYGLYNGTCVAATSTTGYTTSIYGTTTTTGAAASCQASCPSGYVQTAMGCLPRYSGCANGSYCAGFNGSMCYWSTYTLQTGVYQ